MPENCEALGRLQHMIEAFLHGTDQSIHAANEIEGFLIEHFYDDDEFANLLIALASYRPGGGESLHDFKSIRTYCLDAVAEILLRHKQ